MRRALISVTDKTGVVDFAKGLSELGFSILSTGGTSRALREGGVDVEDVADYTGFPEIMDGRVKTLHPKVHGSILARRDTESHLEAMSTHSMDPIDVLCVNLYQFRETVNKEGVTRPEIIENIDIGGPSMIRSAAKNHRDVAVVVDPGDYQKILDAMRAGDGKLHEAHLRALAAKAFSHTASYDAAIARWFDEELRSQSRSPEFSARLTLAGEKLQDLRYGENPHQAASFFTFGDKGPSLASARQVSGKELSYNNILDADAALGLALESVQPACVVVKHNNPCGTGVATEPTRACELALAGDPTSAFGGILATNCLFSQSMAEVLVQTGTFLEVILAPGIEDGAVTALGKARWGASVRVLDLGGLPENKLRDCPIVRQVQGGYLVQTADRPRGAREDRVVTRREPGTHELEALSFAWTVAKHVRSNAIVLARWNDDGSCQTVGVGAGQMSRVDSAKIACDKAGERARGAVLAGDAFFPFPDGLQVCADAGVTAVIQPGGSKRDEEVIAAADQAGMSMLFTGVRHFRH